LEEHEELAVAVEGIVELEDGEVGDDDAAEVDVLAGGD